MGPNWSEIFKYLLVLVPSENFKLCLFLVRPEIFKILGVRAGTVSSMLTKRMFGPGQSRSGFSKMYLALVRFGP